MTVMVIRVNTASDFAAIHFLELFSTFLHLFGVRSLDSLILLYIGDGIVVALISSIPIFIHIKSLFSQKN